MTEPTTEDREPHAEAMALPWYLNGTLPEAERRELESHLTGCSSCREELESQRALRAQFRVALDGLAQPAPGLARQVMAEVRRDAGRSPPDRMRNDRAPPFADRLASLFRQLLAPKWAPVLAVALVSVQFGWILWSVRASAPAPVVTTRSLAPQATRLRILFAPTASVSELQAALAALGASIVAGPLDDGGYIVELAADDARTVQAAIDALRANSAVVRQIEIEP